jgi:hypothetical protein
MEIDDLRKKKLWKNFDGKDLKQNKYFDGKMLLTYAVCRLHGLKARLVLRLVWRYYCLYHQCSKMQRLVVWQTSQMMLLFWGLAKKKKINKRYRIDFNVIFLPQHLRTLAFRNSCSIPEYWRI